MNSNLLKENRIHGTPLYPVSIYEIDCGPGQPLLDLHWHDELEFLMITRGSAVFRIDANDYELKAGEAFFANTGVLHSGYTSDSEGCSFQAAVFHADMIGGGRPDLAYERHIQPLLQKKHAVPVHLGDDVRQEREILEMLREVVRLNLEQEPLYELTTKGLLHLIMSRFLMLGGPAKSIKEQPAALRGDRLKTVLEYIQVNFSSPIRLSVLARLVSMSEAYFCRFFKEITARSPIDYINQVRIQKAAVLLMNTDKKMTDIALDVGFNTPSYFISVFKGHFGCTPTEYRKRY